MSRLIGRIGNVAWASAAAVICAAIGVYEWKLVEIEVEYLKTLSGNDLIAYLRNRTGWRR